MAAGKLFFYDRWMQYVHSGDFNFITNTVAAIPLHNGYSPGTHSHSAFAQIANFRATASGTIVGSITLSGKEISQSGNGTIKIDANDINGFSADGDTFHAKYVALFVGGSASSGGVDQPLIGFFDTDTGSSTGVSATQLNVSWASGGVGKIDVN